MLQLLEDQPQCEQPPKNASGMRVAFFILISTHAFHSNHAMTSAAVCMCVCVYVWPKRLRLG